MNDTQKKGLIVCVLAGIIGLILFNPFAGIDWSDLESDHGVGMFDEFGTFFLYEICVIGFCIFWFKLFKDKK